MSNRVPLETVQHVTFSTLFLSVVIIIFVRVISLLWVAATRRFLIPVPVLSTGTSNLGILFSLFGLLFFY